MFSFPLYHPIIAFLTNTLSGPWPPNNALGPFNICILAYPIKVNFLVNIIKTSTVMLKDFLKLLKLLLLETLKFS